MSLLLLRDALTNCQSFQTAVLSLRQRRQRPDISFLPRGPAAALAFARTPVPPKPLYHAFFSTDYSENTKLFSELANSGPWHPEVKDDFEAPAFNNNSLLQPSTTPEAGFRVCSVFPPTGDQPEAIRKVLEQLKDQNNPVAILRGITGTGKTHVMAHVIAGLQKRTLVLCHNKTLAAQLTRELKSYLGDSGSVELFASYYNLYVPESFKESTGRYTSKKTSINRDIDALRHRATRALLTERNVVVVATVSCMFGLGLPEEYLNASVEWTRGQVILDNKERDGSYASSSSASDVFRMLQDMSYRRVNEDKELEPGTYQHYFIDADKLEVDEDGGTVVQKHKFVICPPHENFPLAVWADKCRNDSGRDYYRITCLAQGNVQGMFPVASLRLFPARHHVIPPSRIEEVCQAIEEELRIRTKEFTQEKKYSEAERLQKRVTNDVAMIRETGFCSGVENYSRHFASRAPGVPPSSLLDYFARAWDGSNNNDWLLLVDESHVTIPQISAMYLGDRSRKMSLIKHGYRLPSALDNRPLAYGEFWQRVRQTLFISATPSRKEMQFLERSTNGEVVVEPVDMVIRPTHVCDPAIEVRPQKDCLQDLLNEIRLVKRDGSRSLIMTLTKRDAMDLALYLNENKIESTFIHSDVAINERSNRLRSLQQGEVDCVVGVNCLREGLDLPQISLVAVLHADSGGFLRSETALLQVVGRAARNKNGKAIFYANRITDGMQRCIDLTETRRQMQLTYNDRHGLEPKSTEGSTIMSIFDLLKEEIKAEQKLVIETPDNENENAMKEAEKLEFRLGSIETDHIPSSPGVYKWKDKDEKVLYIGKAVKLRSRIRSYLRSGAKQSIRIKNMIEKAASVEFILCPSERDALVLESNLIKKEQPLYNVLLKDDNHYPYICASVGDKLPKFSIVSRVPPRVSDDYDAAPSRYRYFGPYTSFKEINSILEEVENKYKLRDKFLFYRHDSGSTDEYNEAFQKAMDEVFCSKSSSQLKNRRQEYEAAGLLFDSPYNKCRDVVAVVPVSETKTLVQVVQLREGYVLGRFHYECELLSGMNGSYDELAEVVQTILETKHYPSGKEVADEAVSWFPEEVLLPFDIPDPKRLQKAIRNHQSTLEPKRKCSIKAITKASQGEKAAVDEKVLLFANTNAVEHASQIAQRSFVATSIDGTASRELASLLSLKCQPSRIECYDISHTQGGQAVGSRVVFVDGKPVYDLYLKFNIETVKGIDDYASITEVVKRRFLRVQDSSHPTWAIPDLIVIDGGQGQLSAAMEGLALANVVNVPICSIAKKNEAIFVPNLAQPVNHSPDSPALLLLRHLRDESHRFALQSHRNRRSVLKSQELMRQKQPFK